MSESVQVRVRKRLFWAKVRKTRTCWVWSAAVDIGGCGVFGQKPSNSIRAHRFSYMISHGPIPVGKCVIRTCDNKLCVRPSHLVLGTRADSNKRLAATGRARGGIRKLTPEIVRQLRQSRDRFKIGFVTRSASRLGVVPSVVSEALRKITWTHL
jgi:hypothetical protein